VALPPKHGAIGECWPSNPSSTAPLCSEDKLGQFDSLDESRSCHKK